MRDRDQFRADSHDPHGAMQTFVRSCDAGKHVILDRNEGGGEPISSAPLPTRFIVIFRDV